MLRGGKPKPGGKKDGRLKKHKKAGLAKQPGPKKKKR